MIIYDFQFSLPRFHVQRIIFHCLITISIENCSFAIVNPAILLSLMSDSSGLIPQSFFPHTISTIMVVDDNTNYGT